MLRKLVRNLLRVRGARRAFRCRGALCPGLSWPAYVMPHPRTCLADPEYWPGAALLHNNLDGPFRRELSETGRLDVARSAQAEAEALAALRAGELWAVSLWAELKTRVEGPLLPLERRLAEEPRSERTQYCVCGGRLAGGVACESNFGARRCSSCGHALSHDACPRCQFAAFLEVTRGSVPRFDACRNDFEGDPDDDEHGEMCS